jgi:glycerol-3-phosphate dehydrogenase (NAD(P)+)
MNNPSAAILGAGSWGTAIAILLSQKGIDVNLWARNRDFSEKIKNARENTKYLPGFPFPESLWVTHELREAVSGREAIILAIPSHGIRKVAEDISKIYSATPSLLPKAIILATKGIENETLFLMSQVMEETLPPGLSQRIAVITGPSFAKEVALSLPTAVAVSATNKKLLPYLQNLFFTDTFRVYSNPDMTGVQLGGALKNVMAIATGISDGMGFGTNTRAALITRGLAEMARLGIKMEANPLTFAGLAGLGDLVLTCTGDLSRNRQVGLRLGRGESISNILSSMSMVAEGVKTAKSAHDLAIKHHVDMPITTQVYRVIYEALNPQDAVKELLSRPFSKELPDTPNSSFGLTHGFASATSS